MSELLETYKRLPRKSKPKNANISIPCFLLSFVIFCAVVFLWAGKGWLEILTVVGGLLRPIVSFLLSASTALLFVGVLWVPFACLRDGDFKTKEDFWHKVAESAGFAVAFLALFFASVYLV